ncbi:VPLPA-CTERM sorting domain-containing protein [Actibacterium sp. 188UL27-1]|uniref:VPLPA-CTERM sorting domain-containing protein n=1 Tax=Actibacterium sp. 188UL27-1 TaxID=2786961 RepID=UPI00195ACA24|nr:VPLPA-CTERM sorting domain-containing protein [Actibacterium sp. 188UL27-1]MBM7070009.1 VPLPA-CTERM sorting domain-containing protein [Actibacterium sp. 188UL27-1]
MPAVTLNVQGSLTARTALGRFALGVAAGTLAGGYGRITYAGTCAAPSGIPGTYLCSGPANAAADVTQSFGPVDQDIAITSAPDFGLDTTQSGGPGIVATGDKTDGADNITITTGNVRAAADAISAGYQGSRYTGPYGGYGVDFGSVTITTTQGQVTSQSAAGIRATGNEDYIEITTSNVTGATGIVTNNTYYGLEHSFTQIDTSAGTVRGTTSAGITASDGDIQITTADVTGASHGISVAPGDYLLERFGIAGIGTTSGTITGLDGDGITVDGGYIFIDTADVTGSQNGISALASANSRLQTDTTAGTVSGMDGIGILATMEEGFLGSRGEAIVDITTADVSGGDIGIQTSAGRYIETVIDTTAGSVSGATGAGLTVTAEYARVQISTADVTGGTDGITVSNPFATTIFDTTAGTITGETGAGIATGFYGEVQITTADVTGQTDGITVSGLTSSNSDVTSTLDTTAGTITGKTGDGITIDGFETSEIDITVSDVSGATTGIRIEGRGSTYYFYSNQFPPQATIDVQGHVSGAVGIAISDFDGPTTINSSGLIEGREGTALDLSDGAQHLTISKAAMALPCDARPGLIGASVFGGGDDMLSFVDGPGGGNILYDGAFDGLFDGGAGIDTVNLSVSFDDLQGSNGSGSSIALSFLGALDQTATLYFLDFEFFTFADNPQVTYALDGRGGFVAPIPLPASLLLFGSALGALAVANRKTRGHSSKSD